MKLNEKRTEEILWSVFVGHYFKWCLPEERNKPERD